MHYKNLVILSILYYNTVFSSSNASSIDVREEHPRSYTTYSSVQNSSSSGESNSYDYAYTLKEEAIKKCQETERRLTDILQDVIIENRHPKFINEKDDKNSKEMLIAQVRGRFSNPEDFFQKHMIQRDNKKFLKMMCILDFCEVDRFRYPFKPNIPGIDNIEYEFDCAIRNGHIVKKGEIYQEIPLKEEFFSFHQPSPEQTILVLGCGHQSPMCPNHKLKSNPTHYTVDIDQSIKPDTVSNFDDKRLWECLKEYSFKEVILEGINVVSSSFLMKSIFNVLKPEGVVKTLHYHSSMWVRGNQYTENAFLYNATIPLINKPLLSITFKEHLENIGFMNVKIYIPTENEDRWENPTEQLCATKPSGIDTQVSRID